MATTAEQCPNYATNKQQCPCSNIDCESWAICCECRTSHTASGGQTFCMRDTERPAETLSLPIGEHKDCVNREANREACPCTETSCERNGICCDCIRFHWGNTTWPSTACMPPA